VKGTAFAAGRKGPERKHERGGREGTDGLWEREKGGKARRQKMDRKRPRNGGLEPGGWTGRKNGKPGLKSGRTSSDVSGAVDCPKKENLAWGKNGVTV